MPVASHPKIWWNFCMLEDEKIEIELTFTLLCASVVYSMEVSGHFSI